MHSNTLDSKVPSLGSNQTMILLDIDEHELSSSTGVACLTLSISLLGCSID